MWDERFLKLAAHIAEWSKDPSTKIGAVVVKDRKILGTGYNGFPTRIDDDIDLLENREEKYPRVVHAEVNAIINAKTDLSGATLYTTHIPCSSCAGVIINAGIHRVFTYTPDDEFQKRWPVLGHVMLVQAGLHVVLY
jgi:dCMP deaminase|tara:strand:- start:26611 stop:27021 length:411 start_codon:yes stop_codon:yes gene_type:complete